ncbi:MAG TPA: HEAT repeat domain-containing protein [Gemmataceae bacterium]|nr:HEAT repeat domain-containing protein [Gemmataceae bacterium]
MSRHTWLLLLFVALMLSASVRAVESAPAEEKPVYQGKTLAGWVEDLKDPKWEIQRAAVQSLAVFGPKKAIVSALATALKNEHAGIILPAAQTLGKFGLKAKEALPELRAAYKRLRAGPPKLAAGKKYSKEYLKMFVEARRAVAEALILIDDHPGPELAPILLESLKTDDADKRRDVVIRLGKLGPDAAKTTVPALIGILTDTEERVRRESGAMTNAAAGGIPLASSSSELPLEKVREIRLEAVKSLGRIGSAAKPALHAVTLAMKSAAPDKNTRVQQMEVADKPVRAADATNRTISFTLVTGDKAMLQACAEALGRIRPEAKGTIVALRLALRDLDEGVRWAALCALVVSGQDKKEVVPILRQFRGDKDAALRRLAVEILGKSGAEREQILTVLTEALKDKDASVRESAAKALGEMGTKAKETVPALVVALKDAKENVREAAAESLGKIGAADKEVVAALIAAMDDKVESVGGAAGLALTKFGHPAKQAIPVLIAHLENADPKHRGRCCLLLGLFGSTAKEAIPVLEKMSREDPAEWVRLGAYAGLAKIDTSRLKGTVRRLATALQSKREDIRGAAVECLGYLGPDARDALPALRALRESSNDISLNFALSSALEEIEKPKKKSGER